MKNPTLTLAAMLASTALGIPSLQAISHEHFTTAVYVRSYEVEMMRDPQWLSSTWATISSQVKVDKIYLETHRDLKIVDSETLKQATRFFQERGIEVAGGITYTIDESNLFETYCYTRAEDRRIAQEVIEHTAKHFDEIILDDFFFTSCKCPECVSAKGDRNWTDYRLDLMNRAAVDLILEPARRVNPNARVIIKYPNWYEHFHGLGFDLEQGPRLFHGIYSGTETRDAVRSNQHLQPYLGFLIVQYFNHLAPGRNGGGWVDPFGSTTLDRYGEQLWMTLLAKAPEITLFDYRMLLTPASPLAKAPWHAPANSFDHDAMLNYQTGNGVWEKDRPTVARAAGYSLAKIAPIIGKLGNPISLKSYKPYHSDGEDFLQNYLGMIGIPITIVSEFPQDGPALILTESASTDPEILSRIEQRLLSGHEVVITSGFVRAMQGKGLDRLIHLRDTGRKAQVHAFMVGRNMIEETASMLIPQIDYHTNDSWPLIEGNDGELGWPLLLQADYGSSQLMLLTIPEQFSDLYRLPAPVLNSIRARLSRGLDVAMEGDSKVALFVYDNDTIVLHSFRDEATDVELILPENAHLRYLDSGERPLTQSRDAMQLRGRQILPARSAHRIPIPAHSTVFLARD